MDKVKVVEFGRGEGRETRTKYIPLNKAPYGAKPFFRKHYRASDPWRARIWRTELAIARILLRAGPQENVVKVYGVTDRYIDYQLLDDSINASAIIHIDRDIVNDIRRGLDNLHRLRIIHVDLYSENIVWDPESKQWRIIDFDASGVTDESGERWEIKPVIGRQFDRFMTACKEVPPELMRGRVADVKTRSNDAVLARLCRNKKLSRVDDVMLYFLTAEKPAVPWLAQDEAMKPLVTLADLVQAMPGKLIDNVHYDYAVVNAYNIKDLCRVAICGENLDCWERIYDQWRDLVVSRGRREGDEDRASGLFAQDGEGRFIRLSRERNLLAKLLGNTCAALKKISRAPAPAAPVEDRYVRIGRRSYYDPETKSWFIKVQNLRTKQMETRPRDFFEMK